MTWVLSNHFKAGITQIDDGFANAQNLYMKPYVRVGAYIVGIITGFMYYEFRNPGNGQGRIGPSIGDKVYNLIRYS